ncbi:MAG: hypothetical protein IJT94_14440 [Oscillibacter sp.]|nr:hypothetical protein [Oscillibacter sp.]
MPDVETVPGADSTPVADSTPDIDHTPVTENTPAADKTPVTDHTPDTDSVPDTNTAPDSGIAAYEAEVIRLVNAIRAQNGLSALAADADLCRFARVKSQDMRDNGYFSHNSPTYGTPFQMMKSFGISYRTAGENIAYGYATPQAVMDGWMNSDGHRANILNASYTRIGVGYVADGHYWTQWFTG